MLDRITVFDADGGADGLGFIQATASGDPSRWFFQAHFHQDPVWPGSLGLESFQQLLKVVAVDRWGGGAETNFEAIALGTEHRWTYRGQVLPTDVEVTVQATIKRIEDDTRLIIAEGFLIIDGRVIYQMGDFGIRMATGGPGRSVGRQ